MSSLPAKGPRGAGKHGRPYSAPRNFAFHCALGALIGFAVLHPASMFIQYASAVGAFPAGAQVVGAILREAFAGGHGDMAFYFTVLGALFGAGQAYYIHRIAAEQQKVRLLEGILPICSSCKRIRDQKKSTEEHEVWVPLEVFISGHSEAEFTHGLCMDCARKLYPQLFEQKK